MGYVDHLKAQIKLFEDKIKKLRALATFRQYKIDRWTSIMNSMHNGAVSGRLGGWRKDYEKSFNSITKKITHWTERIEQTKSVLQGLP